jgi:DNA-binding MarR family transcriptional regulator
MNVIYFGCKRAFHSFLRLTRRRLLGLGLTAARFDLLTAIWRHPSGAFQSTLRDTLGVSAPTASRMLRSLEKLGLVVRERVHFDRRRLHVTLSPKGLASIRRATALIVSSGAIQLAVDCALTRGKAHDYHACLVQMHQAESMLQRLREAFHDIADLHYPWHPDD